LRERLSVLEEFTGKDSIDEVQQLVKDKKNLEKRVMQLEQTNNNWANFHRERGFDPHASTHKNGGAPMQ